MGSTNEPKWDSYEHRDCEELKKLEFEYRKFKYKKWMIPDEVTAEMWLKKCEDLQYEKEKNNGLASVRDRYRIALEEQEADSRKIQELLRKDIKILQEELIKTKKNTPKICPTCRFIDKEIRKKGEQ